MNETYTCAHCGHESKDEGRDRCECGADVGLYELACKDEVLGYLTRNDVIKHLERIKREG